MIAAICATAAARARAATKEFVATAAELVKVPAENVDTPLRPLLRHRAGVMGPQPPVVNTLALCEPNEGKEFNSVNEDFPDGRFYAVSEYGDPDLVAEARDFFNAPRLVAVCDETTGLLAITDPDKAERLVSALEAQRLSSGASTETTGFTPNVLWTPFIKDGRAGMRCQTLDSGEVTYFYFNPSTDGEGEPDVFVYEGPHNDPALDSPQHFYTPDFDFEE